MWNISCAFTILWLLCVRDTCYFQYLSLKKWHPQTQTASVWPGQTRVSPSIPIFGGGGNGEGLELLFDHATSSAENSLVACHCSWDKAVNTFVKTSWPPGFGPLLPLQSPFILCSPAPEVSVFFLFLIVPSHFRASAYLLSFDSSCVALPNPVLLA